MKLKLCAPASNLQTKDAMHTPVYCVSLECKCTVNIKRSNIMFFNSLVFNVHFVSPAFCGSETFYEDMKAQQLCINIIFNKSFFSNIPSLCKKHKICVQ